MNFDGVRDAGVPGWGGDAPASIASEPDAADVLRKERELRDIVALQEGLRALLERVDSVGEACDKQAASNTTLQSVVQAMQAKANGPGR